ncbi:MAG: hypothetical protein AABZ47_04440 [Planctomycetota bacterium]
MRLVIVRRRPQSFAVIIGIVAVLVLTLVGLCLRLLSKGEQPAIADPTRAPSFQLEMLNFKLLVPVVELDVADSTQEKFWIASLAQNLGGQSEVTVPYGRVDVLTENYGIEVDYLHKWKEGIGQALHYAEEKDVIPCLALIYERNKTETEAELIAKIRHIESLCSRKGIRLIILRQR